MKRGLFGGAAAPAAAQMAALDAVRALGQGYGSAYAVPGLVEPGNIDLNTRPRHLNPDDSISTVRSISVGMDGREYVLPTIGDQGDSMTDEQAIQAFVNSGRHLGAFRTQRGADRWANTLHEEEALRLIRGR